MNVSHPYQSSPDEFVKSRIRYRQKRALWLITSSWRVTRRMKHGGRRLPTRTGALLTILKRKSCMETGTQLTFVVIGSIWRVLPLSGRHPVLIDAVIQSGGIGFVGTWGSTMSIMAKRRVEAWHGGITRQVQWGYVGADDHWSGFEWTTEPVFRT